MYLCYHKLWGERIWFLNFKQWVKIIENTLRIQDGGGVGGTYTPILPGPDWKHN